MNSRLTIQDLATLLAERTGKDRNSAEKFLREFVAVVSQGVFTDKQVKVKGFGTFKIILVDKRESIHVNTGERFIIPAHYKFSFLPDKELRELVNKPFSFFETTELNEEVDFTELDISNTVEEKDADTEDESVEEIIPENKEVPVSAEVEQPEIEPEPILSVNDIPDKDEPFDEEEPKASHWVKVAVSLAVAGIAVAAGIFLYLHRGYFVGTETPTPVLTGRSLPETPEVIPKDTVQIAASDTVVAPDTIAVEPETPAAVPEVLAKVKIEPGSRLTLISLDYYGSKIFWVYLYDYNKSVIKDPNNIPVGTEISVPAPSLYGIDKHSRASIEKAAARQTEILSGNL